MDFKKKPILAMIHLAGDDVLKRAMEEIEILEEEGVDGIVVENYHGSVEDMEKVLSNLKTHMIVGLNILPNEYKQAFEMANRYQIANKVKDCFIQLDHVAGHYITGRRSFVHVNYDYEESKEKYPNITVLGGVWPKYYRPAINSNLEFDIKEGMERAEAIVVTGEGTGKQTPTEKVKEFRSIMGEHPLIVGAGLTPSTVHEQLSIADGAIVGSTFKPYKITTQKIERSLVKEFMDEVKKVR